MYTVETDIARQTKLFDVYAGLCLTQNQFKMEMFPIKSSKRVTSMCCFILGTRHGLYPPQCKNDLIPQCFSTRGAARPLFDQKCGQSEMFPKRRISWEFAPFRQIRTRFLPKRLCTGLLVKQRNDGFAGKHWGLKYFPSPSSNITGR